MKIIMLIMVKLIIFILSVFTNKKNKPQTNNKLIELCLYNLFISVNPLSYFLALTPWHEALTGTLLVKIHRPTLL